jgi:predicted acyl esterase
LTPFFGFRLKGKGKIDLPEALKFRTGTNEWMRHEVWPPKKDVAERKIYMREGGKLSFEAPGEKEEFDTFFERLDHLVGGRSALRGSSPGCAYVGERPAHQRSDDIRQGRCASVRIDNGTDSDWIVKPEPVAPDAVTHYQIAFPGNDHVFRKGHRVMVQVQSTWFPVIDRNPQKFVANIFQAADSDFQPATQRIFRSRQHASHILLPVEVK